MILPDANLLVYAYDAGSPWHQRAAAWWTSTLNGEETVGLVWLTVLAFVRIVTHTGINDDPMPLAEAKETVEEWEQTGIVEYLHPGPRHRQIVFDLLSRSGLSGNLVNDAHLAAVALEHNGTIHSNDDDFGRFAGLHWVNPMKS
jgi:toxin-antitoxin system PIN domain toxin